MRTALIVLCCILCPLAATPAAAIPIVDIHQNNSSGQPLNLGTVVTVGGIITCPDGVNSTYNCEVYLQDHTGGVNFWVSGGYGLYNLSLGDSVVITAPIAFYSGLTELGGGLPADVTVTTHSTGHEVPAPLAITCLQLNQSFGFDYREPNEGRLIRINGLTITSGTWPVTTQPANTTITVTDGTASSMLFIDKDSEVNGSPAPTGTFDCIGILKQYDATSPYTSGYEISPRYKVDIVYHSPGPLFTTPPYLTDITENGATIEWDTNTASNTWVQYGLTTAYGSGAGNLGESVTHHVVELTGLTASTLYHYEAQSTDGTGTAGSGDRVLVTASSTPGEMHVYFNGSVDHTYAEPGNEAAGNVYFLTNLLQQIHAAKHSIDCCVYSFSVAQLADSLIAAHSRGVEVRLIKEATMSDTQASRLGAAGIPWINSTYGGNHTTVYGSGINHNKFFVFDQRDETSKTDDWVWTGSWNVSSAGLNDLNSVVLVRDYGLAKAYTLEFNEMWGSDTMTPSAANSRMGSRKSDNTPHLFRVNDILIEQYMSPSDGTASKIIEKIGTADYSLYFCILSFTQYQITNAMLDRRDAVSGLEVRGVFDQGQGAYETTNSQYYPMNGYTGAWNYWSPAADVWMDTAISSSVLLHHKYMVIDANSYSDPMVIAGSHNWSFSANAYNDENTVMIHDRLVSNLYLQEFAGRYHESGGTGALGELTGVDVAAGPERTGTLALHPNVPNPFNPTTRIAFENQRTTAVTLRVYDATGRLVRTLVEGDLMPAGLHVVGWDGTNDHGQAVASGVYLCRLEGAEESLSMKMLLLK